MLTPLTLRRHVSCVNIVPMDEGRPYHHGDLRAALIEAALAEIERHDYESLSLRELAASLGVSRAAPYRHFADRRALLSALAERGFAELTRIHVEAEQGEGAPGERLNAAGRGYLAFAAAKPQLFRLMFASDLLTGEAPPDPKLVATANHSYAVFERMVAVTLPGADDKTVKATAIAYAASTYGFALMRREKRLKPFMLGGLTDADLIEALFTVKVRLKRHGLRRRTASAGAATRRGRRRKADDAG